MTKISAFFFVIILCYQIFGVECNNSPQAIQIVSRKNGAFQLELNDLKRILEMDAIKDRYVVVVSIAGAFRKGKSFLMNFFIKYLNARYKQHNVSDWLGEDDQGTVAGGFRWRNGQKPETMGIWMWSEVFTYDSENGDKIAIVLFDTQGIFDDKTSIKDCTTIFAISTMLSSVQCFNIMQIIQEDHLQQLEFFTEYGRIVQQQTNKTKPFQKLLFLVRDWQYKHESSYGNGQAVIDKILESKDEQTPEMQELRNRIKSSFQRIDAYLLPHPGKMVAQEKEFFGDIQQIDPEFREYVKKLVVSLFAPEHLVIKKINGQKIRAGDLVQYFQTYLKTFNGDSLPKPKTMFEANIEASMSILHRDCINHYVKTMSKNLEGPFFKPSKLINLHKQTKAETISQFLGKPKLGSEEHVSASKNKLEDDIEDKYSSFEHSNSAKQKIFEENETLKRRNEQLVNENRQFNPQSRSDEAWKIIKTVAGMGIGLFAGGLTGGATFVGPILGGIGALIGYNS